MKHDFIKDPREFKYISRAGKAANSVSLKAKYTQGKINGVRLGIVVPNAMIPSAVKRNRIKRIIRSAFRDKSIKSNIAIDIVVFAKRQALSLEFSEALDLIKRIIEKP